MVELPKFAAGGIDAVITDPPFAFTGGMSNGRSGENDGQFFRHWWRDVCKGIVNAIKQDGEGFCWCDWRTAGIIGSGFYVGQKYTWRVSQMLYHYREMPGQGRPFRSSVDQIAYLRGPKSDGHRIPNTTHNWISQYWYYGKHEHHPAEKSVKIVKQLLEWCSDPGDRVLDPFCGSGTTGVACIELGRDFIGIELSEQYADLSRKRLDEATRQQVLVL